MKLLFVIPYVPTKIRTRPYHLLRGLAQRGHRLTLATLWESAAEQAELDVWREMGVEVLVARLSRTQTGLNLLLALPGEAPLQARYCWQPGLAAQLGGVWREGRPWDAVHVEHLRGAPYALELKKWMAQLQRTECSPLVWDSVDCISLLFEKTARSSRSLSGRMKALLDLSRTRRYEGWLAGQFSRSLVTAEADRAAMADLAHLAGSPAALTVLPNGVDLENFAPAFDGRGAQSIVMSGKMSYHANVSAALYLVEQVMPVVWAEYPQARVDLVGANPPAELRTLASRSAGRVHLSGTVDTLVPYLQRATIAAAPVPYGVGIQNKVLEALACAAPVVASPQAVSALRVRDGRELLVADTPSAFASAILRLLRDAGLRRALSENGRRYVAMNHGWEAVLDQLENIYREG